MKKDLNRIGGEKLARNCQVSPVLYLQVDHKFASHLLMGQGERGDLTGHAVTMGKT